MKLLFLLWRSAIEKKKDGQKLFFQWQKLPTDYWYVCVCAYKFLMALSHMHTLFIIIYFMIAVKCSPFFPER